MRDGATFIKRKRSHLPLKYVRRSIKGFGKRPFRASDVQQLQEIDVFYKEFIELPY